MRAHLFCSFSFSFVIFPRSIAPCIRSCISFSRSCLTTSQADRSREPILIGRMLICSLREPCNALRTAGAAQSNKLAICVAGKPISNKISQTLLNSGNFLLCISLVFLDITISLTRTCGRVSTCLWSLPYICRMTNTNFHFLGIFWICSAFNQLTSCGRAGGSEM